MNYENQIGFDQARPPSAPITVTRQKGLSKSARLRVDMARFIDLLGNDTAARSGMAGAPREGAGAHQQNFAGR